MANTHPTRLKQNGVMMYEEYNCGILYQEDRTIPMKNVDLYGLKMNDWKIWKRLNQPDCEHLLNNHEERLKKLGIKGKVDRRLKDIIAARKFRASEEKARREVEKRRRAKDEQYSTNLSYIEYCVVIANYLYDKVESGEIKEDYDDVNFVGSLRAMARIVGNTVHDLPEVKTGKITLEAFKLMEQDKAAKERGEPVPNRAKIKDLKERLVAEHYYPRSRAGGDDFWEAVKHFRQKRGSFTVRDAILILHSNCETAVATKWENEKELNEHQSRENWTSPPESYRNAGLIVIDTGFSGEHWLWIRLAKDFEVTLPSITEFPDTITEDEARKLIEG